MPKLSTRTEITNGLALNGLMHLVIGGASWKIKLSTLAAFLFGPAQSLKITYTGTPQTELLIPFCPGTGIVPAVAGAGQTTVVAVDGPAIANFMYSESNAPAGSNRLTTLSFDDLVSVQFSLSPGSMQGLTSFSGPELLTCNNFSPGTMNALTTLYFPKLRITSNLFGPNGMNALTTLSFPLLKYVGGSFAPSSMPLLTTFSFPQLERVNVFSPQTMAALTNLTLPALVEIGGIFNPSVMAALTTFSFPLLEKIGGNFSPSSMASLTSLSFPSLKSIGINFSPNTMTAVTTVSFPAMISYGGTITIPSATMPNVDSVTLGTIGTLKEITGATITLSGLKLDSASVNGLLALLVSLDGTNGTTLWGAGKTLTINGGTNAAPSGQGITDKATLQARGATVTTN